MFVTVCVGVPLWGWMCLTFSGPAYSVSRGSGISCGLSESFLNKWMNKDRTNECFNDITVLYFSLFICETDLTMFSPTGLRAAEGWGMDHIHCCIFSTQRMAWQTGCTLSRSVGDSAFPWTPSGGLRTGEARPITRPAHSLEKDMLLLNGWNGVRGLLPYGRVRVQIMGLSPQEVVPAESGKQSLSWGRPRPGPQGAAKKTRFLHCPEPLTWASRLHKTLSDPDPASLQNCSLNHPGRPLPCTEHRPSVRTWLNGCSFSGKGPCHCFVHGSLVKETQGGKMAPQERFPHSHRQDSLPGNLQLWIFFQTAFLSSSLSSCLFSFSLSFLSSPSSLSTTEPTYSQLSNRTFKCKTGQCPFSTCPLFLSCSLCLSHLHTHMHLPFCHPRHHANTAASRS